MGNDLEASFGQETIREVVRERTLASQNVPVPLSGNLKGRLAPIERAIIDRELAKYHGSREKTASSLGISRSALFDKMRKYDLLERDYSSG